MGLQTELFIASEEDAARYDGLNGNSFERIQLGGLTNLEFETLWAIFDDAEWDAKRHGLKQIASTNASWTFQFPAAYLAKLQSFDANQVNEAAAVWSATEEIAASPDEVLPVIESLVTLARSASAQNRNLFLWTAL
jgi:hypothetical protein